MTELGISYHNKKGLLILLPFFAILLIAIPLTLLSVQKQQVIKQHAQTPIQITPSVLQPNVVNPADKIILKVGEENIYEKDLDTELAYFPGKKTLTTKERLLKKLIKDSIVLQAAKTDGLITLSDSVFNSLNKNYLQRVQLVSSVTQLIENKQKSLSGNIISIWFDNTQPGPAGYNKGKEIALQKITQLQAAVKNKQITIEQAGQQIIQDTNLAQVDPSYAANAILPFSVNTTDKISFDPTFDAKLRSLPASGVSDVYLIKDKDNTGNLVDAVYMFGQVLDRKSGSAGGDFDTWYAQKVSNYAITYY